MCTRSASENAVIAKGRLGAALLADALTGRLDLPERVPEVGNVLETAVDGGEADVGDLVERVELLHDHLADLPRGDLAFAESQHACDDAIDRLVDELGRHRALVQRAPEAFAHLRDVEIRPCPVGLHDLRQTQLDGLVGCESLLAARATAAAANRATGLRDARVDDLSVRAGAERALHRRQSAVDGKFLRERADARARVLDRRVIGRRIEDIGNEVGEFLALEFGETAGRDRRAADPYAGRDERFLRVVRNGILVAGDVRPRKRGLGVLPGDLLRAEIDQEQVAVGAARNDAQTTFLQHFGEDAGVFEYLLLVAAEVLPQGLAKRDGLRRDHVHQRAALQSGNTAELTAFSCAALPTMSPPRGPRSVLCVVLVTKSATPTGVG